MNTDQQVFSKVPEVTLVFWIIKILATLFWSAFFLTRPLGAV